MLRPQFVSSSLIPKRNAKAKRINKEDVSINFLLELFDYGEQGKDRTGNTFQRSSPNQWDGSLADFDSAALSKIDLTTIGGSLGLGLVCAVVPYLLYTKGLERVEPGQASILATIEPFVAAAVGMLCFAEPMTMSKAIGMVLIFCSIVILNIQEK